jgi:pilus assembly protein Flp/PilA
VEPAAKPGSSEFHHQSGIFPEHSVEAFAMRQFTKNLVKFLKAEDGPTAVEYAVMLALIIVVCIGAITTLGNNAKTTFTSVGTTIGGTGS